MHVIAFGRRRRRAATCNLRAGYLQLGENYFSNRKLAGIGGKAPFANSEFHRATQRAKPRRPRRRAQN